MFVDGDLYRDILIPGFEDKSFSFDEEVLDILEDEFVVAVFFIDFWFLTSNEDLQKFRFAEVISVFPPPLSFSKSSFLSFV